MKRNIVRFAAGLLLVLGFGAVLLTANNAAAAACGQVMAGCNNNVFVGVRVCPSTFTHVGDRVGFTVRFFNNDPAACDITNANITLHLPDGRNILVLSNTCILSPNSAPPNGDAFDCPGTDPRCLDNNPADYTVLVTPAMLVHGVSGCPPVTGTDPNTPVIIFAFTTGAGTAVGSPIPDNINGCTTTGIGVIQPCVSCTKSCTNGVGANGIITFGGSVLNCTPLVNTNVPSLSALTISIRDVAAGQTNPVFFVGTSRALTRLSISVLRRPTQS
jgi:hypothetical protein